ncbi:extensin family protein [Octadecabacter antarcticus]|uniref:extensin family protein n=1 Tax=Octadecabacter antarcticus TaxID=1217908 RepID=UPI000686A0A5
MRNGWRCGNGTESSLLRVKPQAHNRRFSVRLAVTIAVPLERLVEAAIVGLRIPLLIYNWDDCTDEGRFLRAFPDSACSWFATTLGPNYNTLHADHFHLQARGWGACR